MGYDMHWRKVDPSEEVAAAQASYFRLNVFGMGRYREVMYELGMIYDDGPLPEWPEIKDFGVTWDEVAQAEWPEVCQDAEPLTPQKLEAAAAYRAARDRVLAWHGSADTPGIPGRKFCSNYGWIVLPAECDAALRIYMARREEIGPDAMDELLRDKSADPGYWGQWLAFLHGAISHDGFTVN